MRSRKEYVMPRGHDEKWERINAFLEKDKAENRTMKVENYEKAMLLYIDVQEGRLKVITNEQHQALLRAGSRPSGGGVMKEKISELVEYLRRKVKAGRYPHGFTKTDIKNLAVAMELCNERQAYRLVKKMIERRIIRHYGHERNEGRPGEKYVFADNGHEVRRAPETPERAETYEDMDKYEKAILEAKPIIHDRRQSVVSCSC